MCEKLQKKCPNGYQNRPKIDKKVMKIEIRNSIENIMQKSVKIDASRPCWERFWLQSEFKSQDSSMVKKISKKYPKNDPTLSQNPTKNWFGS